MRWLSRSKSIREMEKQHEERRLRLKEEVEALFEDDEDAFEHNYLGLDIRSAQNLYNQELSSLVSAAAMQSAQLRHNPQHADLVGTGLGGLGAGFLGGLF